MRSTASSPVWASFSFRLDRGLRAGLKVSVLVEDAVVGQVGLVVDPGQDTVVDHRSGIVDIIGPVHKAHHGGQ